MSYYNKINQPSWDDEEQEKPLPIFPTTRTANPVHRQKSKVTGAKRTTLPKKEVVSNNGLKEKSGQVKENLVGNNFEKSTMESVGAVSRFVWSVVVRGMLYTGVVGGVLADIFGGTLALALIFTNSSEFAGVTVGSALVSFFISAFTSSIQILLYLIFTKNGKHEMDLVQKISMFTIMIGDTLFDMTVPFWWTYGETPLNMVVSGKPFMFYVAVTVFTLMSLSSERVVLWVAKNGKSIGR